MEFEVLGIQSGPFSSGVFLVRSNGHSIDTC